MIIQGIPHNMLLGRGPFCDLRRNKIQSPKLRITLLPSHYVSNVVRHGFSSGRTYLSRPAVHPCEASMAGVRTAGPTLQIAISETAPLVEAGLVGSGVVRVAGGGDVPSRARGSALSEITPRGQNTQWARH